MQRCKGWTSGCRCSLKHPLAVDHPPRPSFLPPSCLQDAESQVLWWVVSICDPAAWAPGQAEAAGQKATWRQAKNRNLIVRWG